VVDIDFDKRTLSIKRQVVRTGTQGLVIKNRRQKRAGARLGCLIKRSRNSSGIAASRQQSNCGAGPRWHDEGYVFTTTIGTPIDPRNASSLFNELRDASGVREQRFHDQRHWCATLLLAPGVPILLVKELLGHTLLSTTMDLYGHVLAEDKRRTADSMDAIFQGRKEA
jgi:integrase